jgi:CspA family cold shock protein
MTRERQVMTGKVIWFNKVKGYGFIARSGGPDVFVHYTAIVAKGYRALAEGDAVEFEVVEGTQGPQATNVVLRPSTPSSDT